MSGGRHLEGHGGDSCQSHERERVLSVRTAAAPDQRTSIEPIGAVIETDRPTLGDGRGFGTGLPTFLTLTPPTRTAIPQLGFSRRGNSLRVTGLRRILEL